MSASMGMSARQLAYARFRAGAAKMAMGAATSLRAAMIMPRQLGERAIDFRRHQEAVIGAK